MNILIIDDEIQPGSPVWETVSWLQEKYTSTKIYVSRCARCTTGDFGEMGNTPDSPTGTISALKKFLETIDILILDLSGLGPLQEDKRDPLTTKKIRQNLIDVGRGEIVVSDEDLADLNGQFSGIGFYHHHYTSLRKVQAVFVVTQYDRGERIPEKNASSRPETEEERIIGTFIDPFCGIDQWRPYTAKYNKERANGLLNTAKYNKERDNGLLKLRARIGCMAALFHDSGYISLDNLSGIEFAAFHDKAVMLVGESGTGKEYAAKFIHRRWIQEQIRGGASYFDQLDPDRHFVAVNCAVLTESLAASLLFGHVAGSFTDATDHSLGLILGKGCGQSLNGPRVKGRTPIGDLRLRTGWKDEGHNFRLSPLGVNVPVEKPRGTLFLDEFGDLHPNVQAKLLRYLQEWEVEMSGLNGGLLEEPGFALLPRLVIRGSLRSQDTTAMKTAYVGSIEHPRN